MAKSNKPRTPRKKTAPAAAIAAVPRADAAGWVLCEGDRVNLVPLVEGAQDWKTGCILYFYHDGLRCVVQGEGNRRPDAVACTDVRWELPTKLERPTTAGQRVRVVVSDKGGASQELNNMDGLLGTVTSVDVVQEGLSMMTVKLEEEEFAQFPTGIYNTDLLLVPTRRDGPWPDANGKLLQSGWLAKVLPDCSKALSGKLVNIIGLYEPDNRTIEVHIVGEDFSKHRILPSLLEWVAGGEKKGEAAPATVATEPAPVEPETDLPMLDDKASAVSEDAALPSDSTNGELELSFKAWSVLDWIIEEKTVPATYWRNVSGELAELLTAGLIEQAGAAYRATAAGIAARPADEAAAVEVAEAPFDYTKLPHFTEVRAAQDAEKAAGRKQEPVAPFAQPGQAEYEARQAATPEPHRVGWAHKDGSQLNHHYNAQGATACGYKRKAGGLSFASNPDSLPRWQRCEKCDAKLTPAAPAPVAEQPAPVAAPAKKTTTFDDFRKILETHSAGLRVLPLASITITRNTRKVFDEAELQGLADSIKQSGLRQNLVVRPLPVASPVLSVPYEAVPDRYELVCGARRYRACQLVGLEQAPALVDMLTDREFLEVQLLENLQRVDVRPADEAQAFAELLRNGYSAEEIGLKVGKGEKFVLQRAKLASLVPFWFDALAEGRLPLVAGHELARLPAHSQVAVKKAVASYYNSAAPHYVAKDISNYIHRVVLRALVQAPFPTEDATLVPAAGPCQSCPKRSGACGLLFEVADAKDTCLDATCYQGKVEAFVKRRTAELLADGKKPLLITSDYETQDKSVLGTKLYTKASDDYKGAKRVYEAVRVDGPYAGEVVRITLDADTGKSDAEISNQKQVDAARLRKERHTKTHRVLIAEKLTADLPAALDQPDGPVFGAILDHLLLEVCSTSKDVLAYLRESWGWEPDEAALKNDYKGKDAQGFWPWQQYVRQAIRPLGWQSKLELYLAIKVRHRMNYDYEDAQFTLAKLIGGHGYPELDAQADEAVEARYYTRKGKKQEAAV